MSLNREATRGRYRRGGALGSIAVGMAACVFFGACGSVRRTREPRELHRPVVERVSEGRVRIRWPASFSDGPVTIYVGATAQAIDRSALLVRASGGSVELTTAMHAGIDDDNRLYYELVPAEGGTPVVTAERRLPLEGLDNFRDLGGYRTRDGRFVRWGVLFRSNDLSQLSDRDLDHLSAIGVRFVCDLRAEDERQSSPDRDFGRSPAGRLEFPIGQVGLMPDEIQEAIRTGDVAALGVRQMMLSAYRSFPTAHAHVWAQIFDRLEQPDGLPFLFHCTAGKDRTGFAAALVLLALGVPEETVYEDYLATNRYRAEYNTMVLRWVPLYSLFRTEKDDLLPLLDARREYLEASLQEIRYRWGSIDAYLEDELGLTSERRETLRANLLTLPTR